MNRDTGRCDSTYIGVYGITFQCEKQAGHDGQHRAVVRDTRAAHWTDDEAESRTDES